MARKVRLSKAYLQPYILGICLKGDRILIYSYHMNFEYAKRQFEENVHLFGNPRTNPEKYNLYRGLENLAIGLGELEARINKIEEMLKIHRQ
jgi:hypothetical protein